MSERVSIVGFNEYSIDENGYVFRTYPSGKIKKINKHLDKTTREYVILRRDKRPHKKYVDRLYYKAFGIPIYGVESKRKYSNELLEAVLKYRETHSVRETEEHFNISWNVIRSSINDRKFELTGQLKKRNVFDDVFMKKALLKKHTSGKTWKEVAKKLGCNAVALQNAIRKSGWIVEERLGRLVVVRRTKNVPIL